MQFDSEGDLVKQLRPKIDGLIMQEGRHRGTFLPSVWEQLPKSEDFLKHLKIKSGLPETYWSDSIQIRRYTVEEF
jgi:AMMECR1 domain-containing protein